MRPEDYEKLAPVDPTGPGVDQTPGAYDVLDDGEHDYAGNDAPTAEELSNFPSAEELSAQLNTEE